MNTNIINGLVWDISNKMHSGYKDVICLRKGNLLFLSLLNFSDRLLWYISMHATLSTAIQKNNDEQRCFRIYDGSHTAFNQQCEG